MPAGLTPSLAGSTKAGLTSLVVIMPSVVESTMLTGLLVVLEIVTSGCNDILSGVLDAVSFAPDVLVRLDNGTGTAAVVTVVVATTNGVQGDFGSIVSANVSSASALSVTATADVNDMSPPTVAEVTVDTSPVTTDSGNAATADALILLDPMTTSLGGKSVVVMVVRVADMSLVVVAGGSNDDMAGSIDKSDRDDIGESNEVSCDRDVKVASSDRTLSDVIMTPLGGVARRTSSRRNPVVMASPRMPDGDSGDMSGRMFRKSAGLRVSISSTEGRPPEPRSPPAGSHDMFSMVSSF